jgi:hypothetical protein
MDADLQQRVIKMAAQAVLFEYKPMLNRLYEHNDHHLLERIADEIAVMAAEMGQITTDTWRDLASD